MIQSDIFSHLSKIVTFFMYTNFTFTFGYNISLHRQWFLSHKVRWYVLAIIRGFFHLFTNQNVIFFFQMSHYFSHTFKLTYHICTFQKIPPKSSPILKHPNPVEQVKILRQLAAHKLLKGTNCLKVRIRLFWAPYTTETFPAKTFWSIHLYFVICWYIDESRKHRR